MNFQDVVHHINMIFISAFCVVFILYTVLLLTILWMGHEPDVIHHHDAIITLGARVYKNNEPNLCLVRRIDRSAELFNENKGNIILVSGGTDLEDGTNEAQVMKQWLIDRRVPTQFILTENLATSTYENIVLSQKIMVEKNLSSALIVTEPFHAARTHLVAQSRGMSHQIALAADSPCSTQAVINMYVLKEPFAIAQYIVTGKISLKSLFQ